MESSIKQIKDALKSKARSVEDLALDAEKLIRNVLIKGLEDPFFQEYCLYAQGIGINFVDGDGICVTMNAYGDTSMEITPLEVIKNVKSEEEILFLVAHEVKHVISRHLSKYNKMFRDEVQALFMNLATDVEVNEGLKEELGRRNRNCVPTSAFLYPDIGTMLNKPIESLNRKNVTVASHVYGLLNQKCIETLGGNFLELLYEVKLAKANFVEELFKVAFEQPSIFTLKDKEEAVRFCKALCAYLKLPMSIIMIGNVHLDVTTSGGEGGMPCSGKSDKKTNGTKNKEGGNGEGEDDKESGKPISKIDGGLTPEELRTKENELVEIASELVNNFTQRSRSSTGSSSGGSMKVEVIPHTIPWQSVLRNRLRAISSHREQTKRRLNRRMPYRLDLSGSKPKLELEVIIAVDESGSVSSKELNYFISEIMGITTTFNCRVHLIRFTSKVESYTFFKKSKDLNPEKVFAERYSGGTVAQVAYDYADNLKKINKNRTVFITLTDGFIESKVDFRGFKNRLWVYTEDFQCTNELSRNVKKLVEV